MNVNKAVFVVLTVGMLVSIFFLVLGLSLQFLGLTGRGYTSILYLAILTLILTPIARVLVAFIGFTVNKDFYNAATALTVLFIVLISFVLGLHLHMTLS